jgi:beta-galactosidase GanA
MAAGPSVTISTSPIVTLESVDEASMRLSTTHYRSPFPGPEYWEDDLAEIAATGFAAIDLFAAWPAAEAMQGEFDFTDIERLV